MRSTSLGPLVLAGVVSVLSLLPLSGCFDDLLSERQAEALDGCQIGGCSSQFCVESGADWVSTCEWEEVYACYQAATCERQSNGACGWRATEALVTCIATH